MDEPARGGTWSPAQGPRPPRPWYRLVAGQWPLALVLLAIAVGVAWVGLGHWKRGSTVIGAAFVLGTLLRAFLPEKQVGLLGVRTRAVDVACLAALGVAIVALALVVPAQT